MKRICLILNQAPLYRKGIFELIGEAFICEWFFISYPTDIKLMDLNCIRNVKFLTLRYIIANSIYWVSGMISCLSSNRHDIYFLTGDFRNLTLWLFLVLGKAFKRKKRFYLWTHGYYGRESYIKRKLKKHLIKLCTGVFVYGERSKELMLNDGINNDKIFVIYNSLDHSKQIEIRKKLRKNETFFNYFGNKNPVIIFIGRLNKNKKIELLLLALEKLKQKGKQLNLVLVGEGSEKTFLKELAKEKNISNQVWFFGACYDEYKNGELIYNSDLCVSPGNVGLTAIHSMTFGTPVITHDNFNNQMPEFEVIEKLITGDFFKEDSVDSLVETLFNWFNADYDRQKIREACFNVIDEKWNPEYQINLLKSVFEKR